MFLGLSVDVTKFVPEMYKNVQQLWKKPLHTRNLGEKQVMCHDAQNLYFFCTQQLWML
jgi:hypothetical protein